MQSLRGKLSLCGSRLVHQGTFATWIISILFWVSIYLHLVKKNVFFLTGQFHHDVMISSTYFHHRSMMFLGALEAGAPKAVTGRCWQLDFKARLHQDLPCTSCSILWLIDADLGVQLWLLNGSDICSSMIIACNSHPHGIMALHRLGHPSTFSTLSFLAFSRALPNISGVLTRETVPWRTIHKLVNTRCSCVQAWCGFWSQLLHPKVSKGVLKEHSKHEEHHQPSTRMIPKVHCWEPHMSTPSTCPVGPTS